MTTTSLETLRRRIRRLEQQALPRKLNWQPVVHVAWAAADVMPDRPQAWPAPPGLGVDPQAAREAMRTRRPPILIIPAPLPADEWERRAKLHQRRLMAHTAQVLHQKRPGRP